MNEYLSLLTVFVALTRTSPKTAADFAVGAYITMINTIGSPVSK